MSSGRVPPTSRYVTRGGVTVRRSAIEIDREDAIESTAEALDERRGAVFLSDYEYPGRYNRWSRGFVDPPVVVESRGRAFELSALNDRGVVLLSFIASALEDVTEVCHLSTSDRVITGTVAAPSRRFAEEERSKQPSMFSVLRAIRDLFAEVSESHLGLDGAFGYDLVFQFEDLSKELERSELDRDLVLYLPDDIIVVDHAAGVAMRYLYEFERADRSTAGVARTGSVVPYSGPSTPPQERDHETGEYAVAVELARDAFKKGDLFEVVLGQSFFRSSPSTPSEIFARLRRDNPAPYSALLNLGGGEYLISASPEMFVRVSGTRIETCPIAGTVARGKDVFEDSRAVVDLLTSKKATSELTMCTDVDRNDKSRICEPESVRVIGRRQVEFYSRVIHTVDHVEGVLRPGFDAIDAFLSHMWAVTVTGAPKLWSMRFIEKHEKSPRRWYSGALGTMLFNGDMNTGLTIRTIAVRDGVAEVRVGNTLLIDSVPADEEEETEVKAAAFLAAIMPSTTKAAPASPLRVRGERSDGTCRVLLVDNQDSFVHTIAGYLRRVGAEVITMRAPMSEAALGELMADIAPDLVFISPGPGRPEDFDMTRVLERSLARSTPVFGVCLGLQGIVEYFGGSLGQLDYPMHGKPSVIRADSAGIFEGLPHEFIAGRYHSLFANEADLPTCLRVTARSEDGVIMAVEHRELPVAAVQFHPESVMSAEGDFGLQLIASVLDRLGDASADAVRHS